LCPARTGAAPAIPRKASSGVRKKLSNQKHGIMNSTHLGPILPQLSANVERFDGIAECYDAHRSKPPLALLDRLTRLIQVQRPRLVVDLGCGTGLSTRIWAARAEEVVGIDPNKCMVDWARKRTEPEQRNLKYRKRFSHDTGLPNGCADIVTAVQSLHWMEPQSTIDEVFRILRPGGVFAITEDYRLPMLRQEALQAYEEFLQRMIVLLDTDKNQHPDRYAKVVCWPKDQHVAYMREGGQFRFLTECLMHGIEMGNADRLIGLALSQSSTFILLKQGFSKSEIGIDDLRIAAKCFLSDQDSMWRFSFQTVFAVK
jgi:ubiquinone/menaquinone biosynthesis C-methylase UbiE